MKKNIFALFLCCSALAANAQSSAGLIAHWDFNGTTNDVTANGHNGTGNGVVDTAGITGASHTAYYFDGSTSVVTAPYLPDLNLSVYSICAVVKPTGYYQGTCLTNTIFTRGIVGQATGTYNLFFTNVVNECATTDTTSEVFGALAGPNNIVGTISAIDYSPHIVKDNWYKVVATYDGTRFRIYVNGVLMSNVAGQGMPIGSSTDGISIGKSVYDPSGYPYFFKGFMDDVRLYDRVLADTEVVHYWSTCGTVTTQPVKSNIPVGGTSVFTIATSISSPVYQWQENTGSGFTNLTNGGHYSGVSTSTLTITNVTTAQNANHYRCFVYNTAGCADTSTAARTAASVDNGITSDMVHVFPDPARNYITIQLPYANGMSNKAGIELVNELGQILYAKATTETITTVDLSSFPAGIYIVRINVDGQSVYKKIMKN